MKTDTVPLEVILRTSIGGGAMCVVSVATRGDLKAAQLANLITQLSLMEQWFREDEALTKLNACRHPRSPSGVCVSCGDEADDVNMAAE